jgi:histidine triad (HIT) family protein
VYEDEHVFAFLDINPIFVGHTLIVPKKEVDYFVDVPEPHYSAVFKAAKKIAPALQDATGCKRVGLTVIGLEVPHFHLHVVPMWAAGDIDFRKSKKADPAELKAMQAELQKRI